MPEYQRTAQRTIQKRLTRLEKAYGITANSLQAGLVLTTTDTGEVLAVVGGRNLSDIGFNRAVTAQRPIGFFDQTGNLPDSIEGTQQI